MRRRHARSHVRRCTRCAPRTASTGSSSAATSPPRTSWASRPPPSQVSRPPSAPLPDLSSLLLSLSFSWPWATAAEAQRRDWRERISKRGSPGPRRVCVCARSQTRRTRRRPRAACPAATSPFTAWRSTRPTVRPQGSLSFPLPGGLRLRLYLHCGEGAPSSQLARAPCLGDAPQEPQRPADARCECGRRASRRPAQASRCSASSRSRWCPAAACCSWGPTDAARARSSG